MPSRRKIHNHTTTCIDGEPSLWGGGTQLVYAAPKGDDVLSYYWDRAKRFNKQYKVLQSRLPSGILYHELFVFRWASDDEEDNAPPQQKISKIPKEFSYKEYQNNFHKLLNKDPKFKAWWKRESKFIY